MFHGVSVLKVINNGLTQTAVLNLTDDLRKIINYFGPLAQQFYGVIDAAAGDDDLKIILSISQMSEKYSNN